jgi:hypothetical protein
VNYGEACMNERQLLRELAGSTNVQNLSGERAINQLNGRQMGRGFSVLPLGNPLYSLREPSLQSWPFGLRSGA